jgi:hypothetical protein
MSASVRLRRGKAEFVRWDHGNGDVEDICLCWHNVDFSGACIAQVNSDLLGEVIEHGGRYAEGNLENYKKDGLTDDRCGYCYDKKSNWGPVTSYDVDKRTVKDFDEVDPTWIRIGKSTECGHDYYHGVMIDFLKLCKERGVGIIFPTKALRLSEDVVEVLNGMNHVINYSIGHDEMEKGISKQGYDNKWRIEQARLYHNEGVNATLTITCDVTDSIEANVERGFAVGDALSVGEKYNITARVLPLRLTSKEVAKIATGMDWKDLFINKRRKETLPGFADAFGAKYVQRGNSDLVPRILHPDFQKLVKNGLGVCGNIGENEHCDECHVYPEETKRVIFPVEELVKVTRDSKRKRRKPVKIEESEEEPKVELPMFPGLKEVL